MDLERQAAHVPGRVIETVFLGGGTPSLLAAQSIARLFTGIRERVDLAPDAEISL
jgi:oxygen-independent coproporphyrinogen-3 oxidase